jgi:hypothetical protein
MKEKLAIIDADGLIFFAAWEHRERMNSIGTLAVEKKIDRLISELLQKSGCSKYIGFYGESSEEKSFRYNFATIKPYKGHRKDEEWQKFFKKVVRKRFKEKWGFYPVKKLEADDAVNIAFHQFKSDYDIVAIEEDKDGLQKGEFVRLNPNRRSNINLKLEKFEHLEGRKFFWSQMLHGDQTDNIPGIEGVGQGKKGGRTSKNKLVQALWAMEDPSEEDMFNHVRDCYIEKYKDFYLYYLVENYVLLKMLDEPIMDYPSNIKISNFGENIKKRSNLGDLKNLI